MGDGVVQIHSISIHSLRMEGDLHMGDGVVQIHSISIHSLRMEGDSFNTSCAARCSNFNPLPPHGGRQRVKENIPVIDHFNPLPPHGGRLSRWK